MKLLRYGPAGQEKPGLLDRDGKIRDLSGAVRDIDGETLAPASLDRLRRLDPSTLPLVPGPPRLGPWVVTADEVPDPGNLGLWTEVNGTRVQNSNTSDLIFGINEIVSYVSHFMTLLPGDIIPTGTPSGVGLGMNPPQFLKPGDRMRLSVEGLGEQNQRLVAFG